MGWIYADWELISEWPLVFGLWSSVFGVRSSRCSLQLVGDRGKTARPKAEDQSPILNLKFSILNL
jgi:hypothetical protein